MVFPHLIIDVSIYLSPAKIISQGLVCWVADSTAVKKRQMLQPLGRKEIWPAAYVVGSKAADNEGNQFALPPA